MREIERGGKRGSARERFARKRSVYYNELRCIPSCVRHYILRYAYACVIASIVHESAWFMSSYEGRSRCAWAQRRDAFSHRDDTPGVYSRFRPVIHRKKPRLSFSRNATDAYCERKAREKSAIGTFIKCFYAISNIDVKDNNWIIKYRFRVIISTFNYIPSKASMLSLKSD